MIDEHVTPEPDQTQPDAPRPGGQAPPRARLTQSNLAGTIYGLIVIAALLAAESDQHDSYLDALASALIATALYWLAHSYAGLLGRRLEHGERLSAKALASALRHDWTLARGAALPMTVLAIAWASGVSQQAGVSAALWSAIACLISLELFAGIRAGASTRELLLDACVGATLGIAILAVKIVLH